MLCSGTSERSRVSIQHFRFVKKTSKVKCSSPVYQEKRTNHCVATPLYPPWTALESTELKSSRVVIPPTSLPRECSPIRSAERKTRWASNAGFFNPCYSCVFEYRSVQFIVGRSCAIQQFVARSAQFEPHQKGISLGAMPPNANMVNFSALPTMDQSGIFFFYRPLLLATYYRLGQFKFILLVWKVVTVFVGLTNLS